MVCYKPKTKYLTGLAAILLLGGWHLKMTNYGIAESGDTWLRGWYLSLFVASMVVVAVAGYLLLLKRRKIEWIYGFCGLAFGLLYMFVFPPMSAPDEVSHYISAYELSDKIMGQQAHDDEGHILVRAEDWYLEDVYGEYSFIQKDNILRIETSEQSQDGTPGALLGQTLTEETYQQMYDQGFGKHGNGNTADMAAGTMAYSIYPSVRTTPLAYMPQAIGITLARLLNLNSLGLAYMGRLLNLLFFVAMTMLAIRILPFGKEVLFGVALLPMTLHLSASYSYDVMIMAVLFVFTAMCLKLAYEKEKVTVRDLLVLALLMAVAGPCKMVYAPMLGLCLLISVKKFGGWGRWALSASMVLAAWAAAMVLVNSQIIAGYATETENYVGWAGEAGYSLTYLIHNPWKLFKLFYNTVMWQAEHYHMTMIGAYLGNVDQVLDVPYLAVVLLTVSLLLLAFRKPGETLVLTGGKRIWIWLICAACAGVTMLSMLIAWTPISSVIINGVQGRYFLPFLPVFLMSCKNDTLVLTKNPDRMILYVMCCVDAYALLRIFSIVCMRL